MDPYRQDDGDVFYARTFALLTLFIVGVLLYRILVPMLVPLVWAVFIAFLLHPLHRWLVRRLRGRANVSAFLVTMLAVLFLVGPITALVAAFTAQAADALEYAGAVLGHQGLPESSRELGRVPLLDQLFTWLQGGLNVSRAQLEGWTLNASRTALEFLGPLSGKIFLGALGRALSFTLTMFMLFFLIRDGARMLVLARGLIPMSSTDKDRLIMHLGAVVRAVVFGTGLTALIQGALVGVGFLAVGLPSPVVFGVLAALAALLPLLGTPLVWGPAVVVLAAQDRWVAAAVLLGWGVLVSLVDNVLRPVLVSGRGDVGTLPVFIGVLGGVASFGTVGLFLGPVVLALVIALVRFMLEQRHQGAPTGL